MLLVKSSLCVLRAVEVDVTKTAGTSVLGDNTSASATLAVLKLLVEEVVVNLPAEIANKESGALSGSILGLGLLCGSLLLFLLISLALLGGSCLLLGRLGLGLVRVAVRVVRARVGVGVIAVRVGLISTLLAGQNL